jgi:hypothetical protein
LYIAERQRNTLMKIKASAPYWVPYMHGTLAAF